MNIPDDLKYAKTHEWIRLQNDVGTVGITDHAQSELSDVVFVELPKVGASVAAGDAVAVVESVKAASDIYSPVSGEIIEVNDTLENEPSLINTAPFESGWIFRIKPSAPAELDALKTPADYASQIS